MRTLAKSTLVYGFAILDVMSFSETIVANMIVS